MNAEREQRMMIAAKILAGAPFNELPQDELDIMLNHGNIIGGFICGVHWADKNPESPWIHIESRMPDKVCLNCPIGNFGRRASRQYFC